MQPRTNQRVRPSKPSGPVHHVTTEPSLELQRRRMKDTTTQRTNKRQAQTTLSKIVVNHLHQAHSHECLRIQYPAHCFRPEDSDAKATVTKVQIDATFVRTATVGINNGAGTTKEPTKQWNSKASAATQQSTSLKSRYRAEREPCRIPRQGQFKGIETTRTEQRVGVGCLWWWRREGGRRG